MDAERVVASLFAHHVGLDEDATSPTDAADRITNFRDLFRVPALAAHAQKVQLLAAAERTACADVIVDVLLFVAQTMAPNALHRALANTPLCRQQWIQYELALSQQQATSVSADVRDVAVEARVASIVSTLLLSKTRPLDIASVLLQLVFRQGYSASLVATLAIAQEVLRVVTRTKPYCVPPWTIALLREFVELARLQIETERRDAFHAPPARTLSAYFDKRARGANNVNANWRMRSFELDATQLTYAKHDAQKLALSKNPFLDKRVKGSVPLTKQLTVEALSYTGKVSRRPYCIKIGHGDDALIVDACTPVVQAAWMDAIAGNVRRLELDPHWLRFPRPNVLGLSLHTFLRYTLLYHNNATSSTASCDAQPLTTTFNIHEKRVLFASLVALAQRGEWREFERLALTEAKPKLLFTKPTDVDARTAIGVGVLLDIATQYNAPLGLLATLELLYAKHDAKKPVWICHTKTSAGDGVAIDVDALHVRGSRSTSSSSATTTK